MKISYLSKLTLLLLLLSSVFNLSAQNQKEIDRLVAGKEKRLEWWIDARFGLFIHWGLYSKLAGEFDGKKNQTPYGEWIMYNMKIPVKQYKKIATEFNPVGFNADEWVLMARDAGMKYIVITAKHCDGFALFKSEANAYNIVDATPFKRDPLKELEIACKKYGIRLGFYYSQNWDWSEPNALGNINDWDFHTKEKRNPEQYYQTKALPQVKELVTNYTPAMMWFDVCEDTSNVESYRLLKTIREARPNCIINDRIRNEFGRPLVMGDYRTPEQYIPAGIKEPFEVCMTLNGTWGYQHYDKNWKSAGTVIENLIDIASKGGNFLLNVGPDGQGVFPARAVEILKQTGSWLKRNSESIYGTSASPIGKPYRRIYCTARPNKLYIHLFDWPERNELVVPEVSVKVNSVYFLTDKSKKCLDFKQNTVKDLIVNLNPININSDFIDPLSTTLVIEYAGTLKPISSVTLVDQSMPAYLDPAIAKTSNDSLKYGFNDLWTENRGFETLKWIGKSAMSWDIRSIHLGVYEVYIEYGADESSTNNEMKLTIGGQSFPFTTQNTGGWYKYLQVNLGKVTIAEGISSKVVLSPQIVHSEKVMNIKSIILSAVIK